MEKLDKKGIGQGDLEKYAESNKKINPVFKNYYQNLLSMNSGEMQTLMLSSEQKLPITFRINKIYNYCEFLEFELNSILNELNLYDKIKRYNWSNLDNIYELTSLDKAKHKKLKDLLVRENDLGVLRQELVSMIPVSLVDIQEDSVVLDMCAAPGNKSVQILEIMQERAREKNILPTGVLISNELDYKRAEKLVHFLLSQPTINVISTVCPAQGFPKMQNQENQNYQPDFVFCDVPCSGDGTLRKNNSIRKRWKPEYGFKNHTLQIEILENSIRLCKVGGSVVYSTCSINPIENEAVVAHVLQKYSDQIELVEIGSMIKNKLDLNFSEGLIKWKVAYDWSDKENIKWAYDYSQVTKRYKYLMKETMFNEIYTKKNHQNNLYFSDPLNLRRCARFYSHQNNSGSFFVAVIHKKKEITIEKESNMNKGESVPFDHGEKGIQSIKDDLQDFMKFLGIEKDEKLDEIVNQYKKVDTKKINSEIFLTAEKKTKEGEEDIDEVTHSDIKKEEKLISFDKFVKFRDYQENYKILKEFYNFSTEEIINKQLYSLRTASTKILLFSEKLCEVSRILSEMNMKIIHAGLVCFTRERKPFPGKYRLSHYGAIILESIIQNQKLDLSVDSTTANLSDKFKQFFFDFLNKKKIKFEEIEPIELQEKVLTFRKGSLLIIYESVVLLCRKGNNNLSIMIPEIQLNNLISYAVKYLVK